MTAPGGDWIIPGTSIVLPPFADPSVGPATIIGPDLPADLVALYAGAGFTVVGGIVYRQDIGHYNYQVQIYLTALPASQMYIDTGSVIVGLSWFIETRIGLLNSQPIVSMPGPTLLYLDTANGADLQMNGVPQPHGYIDEIEDTTTTGFNGPAEFGVNFTNNVTFPNGRAFEVSFTEDTDSSVANNFASFFLRRNNIAGTLLRFGWGFPLPAVGLGGSCHGVTVIRNDSGADITDRLLLTASCNAGTIRMNGASVGVAGNRARRVRIRDAGPSFQFANSPQL